MRFVQIVLAFLRRRAVKTVLSLGLTLMLGALLIATIQFTLFDLQWLAFLGGILFAAVLAMASQASKAEWLVVRRTRQLERMREQLAQEITRNRTAGESQRIRNAVAPGQRQPANPRVLCRPRPALPLPQQGGARVERPA